MKLKRIFAMAGVILLVGLFVLAIVLAVTGAPKNHLMAVIFSMVFIPIIMFSMGLMAKVLRPSEPVETEESGSETEMDRSEKGSPGMDSPSMDTAANDTAVKNTAVRNTAKKSGHIADRELKRGSHTQRRNPPN